MYNYCWRWQIEPELLIWKCVKYLMEEDCIKPRPHNSLLWFTLFFTLLVVVELQLKADVMFTVASLFICVCYSLSWSLFYINSLICVCPEQGNFDPELGHAWSYHSMDSCSFNIITAFAATLHLSNEVSSEVLFWALDCLPACFLWVWNLISVRVSAQRDVGYWWKAHRLSHSFLAGLFDSRRVRSLTSVCLHRKQRTSASAGFQIEQGPLHTTYHIVLGEIKIITVCISTNSFCLSFKTFSPRTDSPQTCLPLKLKTSPT